MKRPSHHCFRRWASDFGWKLRVATSAYHSSLVQTCLLSQRRNLSNL
jgi:hypothetical protein